MAKSLVLSAEQLEFFHREGYLVAKDVVPRAVIEAVAAEIDALVDVSADELYAAGKIKELHRDLGFLDRTPALYRQCPEITGLVAGGVGYPKITCVTLQPPNNHRTQQMYGACSRSCYRRGG